MPKKLHKMPVSLKAVMARINRKLAADDEQLRAVRGSGNYFIVNTKINSVTRYNVDLEKLARELGVLKEWETLAK